MKLLYQKSRTFPKWSKIHPDQISVRRYYPEDDGIRADFDCSSRLPHANHIEMSGLFCSAIVSYRIDEKRALTLYRHTIFPALRINPDDTRGSLTTVFGGIRFTVNGKQEQVKRVFFNGMLTFLSSMAGVELCRTIYVAPEKKALIEEIVLDCPVECALDLKSFRREKRVRACFLAEDTEVQLTTKLFLDGREIYKKGTIRLAAGKHRMTAVYCAEHITEREAAAEKKKREDFIAANHRRLCIKTPDSDLNREIRFAKLRASESIFQTKNGLMHAPGGGQYYAALWTNDQCEYANPLFACLGYDIAQRQSLNCYRLYSALARPDRAVYSSIIAQGDGFWHGAGDRGDSSMYVYGLTRYLLTTGDREHAREFLPALRAACTYIMHKMNDDLVVESDSDELENRFESGKANLSTAVISYDAFLSMSFLEAELDNSSQSEIYQAFAQKIRLGIKHYFAADVEGFSTYRYCAEETKLRSWICLPLTVGIDDRADGTAVALKSDFLKKTCGLLTRSGEKTFWDRSMLYTIRGLFYVGKADDALEMLTEYTQTRLYGEHVPYPIEAFPEGNGAHLAAESALYVRIFTEGLLGFRPVGFRAFELKVNLPSKWERVSISGFVYANSRMTIEVKRKGERVSVRIGEIGYQAEMAMNQIVTVLLPNAEKTKE